MTPELQAKADALALRLREQEPLLGHLIAASGYKRELCALLGPEAAFEEAKRHLHVPELEQLRHRRVRRLRDAAESSDGFVQLWAGGIRHVHQLRDVRGASDHRPQVGTSRSGWLACLRDAGVRGRSSVLTRADEVLVDFEGDEMERFRDAPEMDPGVLQAGAGAWWMMEPRAPRQLAEEAFKLNGNYTHEFGHWIQEYLPRLGIALLAGLQPMPILVDQNMPASHRDALALFCPGWPLLELPHLHAGSVARLWCASHPNYRGWYPDDWAEFWEAQVTDPGNFARAIAALKARAESALAPPTGVDRVFLARRPRRKKRMHNHDEIAGLAQERGYRVVYPEDLGFVEQLRLMHHARRIVAPDGSNSLLAQFASPGSRTCILNNPHTYPLAELDGLFAAVGNELTVLTGPFAAAQPSAEPYWDEYSIDPEGFARFLDEWTPD